MATASRHLGKMVMLGLVAWVGLAGTPARADFFNFDPDGTNNPNGTGSLPAVTITGLDQAVGNALAKGGNAAIANFVAGGPAAGNEFDLYYQATLQGYSGGNPAPPAGLNSNFQLTFSMKLHEVVTGVTFLGGGSAFATFATATQDATDFFRMYYNGAATTSVGNGNLSGLTFQDGQVILDGTPIIKEGDTSNFQTNKNTAGTGVAVDLFDRNGTDNYPGTKTVVGNGSSVLDVKVNAVDPTFFISAPPSIELHFNTSLVVPFRTVDPSGKFREKDTALSLGATAPGLLVTPLIGTLNGGFPPGTVTPNGTGGPDFQFQADANSDLTAVPEPTSMTLMGLGLAGVFGYGWRRRHQAA